MDINVKFAVAFDIKTKHYKEALKHDITPGELIDKFLKDFESVESADNFSLIFYVKDSPLPSYLRENNMSNLSKIYMMTLCPKKEREIVEIQSRLNSREPDLIKQALKSLSERLSVEEFLQCCIENRLHEEIFKLIEKFSQLQSGDEHLCVLTMNVFAELILYTRRTDECEESDVETYISILNVKPEIIRHTMAFAKSSKSLEGVDSSLKVLVACLKNGHSLKDYLFQNLDRDYIYSLLERTFKNNTISKNLKCSIQISVISYINQCFSESLDNKEVYFEKLKLYFENDRIRNLNENLDILSKTLREFPSALPPAGFNEPSKEENALIQELIKLQYNILYPVYWTMSDTKYSGPKIDDVMMMMKILPIFDNLPQQQAYKKLGFDNVNAPSQDFVKEKGHLVFECMSYMLKFYYNEVYKILTKARDCDHFQFVKVSFSLVKILDNALQLSEAYEDGISGTGVYLPILFKSCEISPDYSSKVFFYELFSKCFLVYSQLLTDSTYKPEDIEQLEKHFLTQINEVINCFPMLMQDFLIWLGKVKSQTDLKKKREAQVREWEDNNTQNPIINILRKELDNEYTAIVSQKRLKQMQERPYSFDLRTKSIQKYSLRLDSTKSIIEVKEESDPNAKVKKWLVTNIKKIMVDRECSHFQQRKSETCFLSISIESEEKDFNFTCTRQIFNIWHDGLLILLKMKPTSSDFKDEVLNLVRLEMKIRFLLITKEIIPSEIPTIPSLPENYNFVESKDSI